MPQAIRIIQGIRLRALDSPSHLAWADDERLRFLFDGTLWHLLSGSHDQPFPSLEAAISFCRPHLRMSS